MELSPSGKAKVRKWSFDFQHYLDGYTPENPPDFPEFESSDFKDHVAISTADGLFLSTLIVKLMGFKEVTYAEWQRFEALKRQFEQTEKCNEIK